MLQANGKKEFAQPHMSVVRPKCKQHWHSSKAWSEDENAWKWALA